MCESHLHAGEASVRYAEYVIKLLSHSPLQRQSARSELLRQLCDREQFVTVLMGLAVSQKWHVAGLLQYIQIVFVTGPHFSKIILHKHKPT